jgi:hypothetical protein
MYLYVMFLFISLHLIVKQFSAINFLVFFCIFHLNDEYFLNSSDRPPEERGEFLLLLVHCSFSFAFELHFTLA